MSRTILTNVGISTLVNPALVNFYTANLARLQDDLRSNRERPDALDLCKKDLTRGLKHIWTRNYSTQARRRREDSPAEVAALSLLQVQPDDRVILLHSDTTAGAFCASLVTTALQIGGIAADMEYPFCQTHQIEVRPVPGLMLTDDLQSASFDPAGLSTAFVRNGLRNFVEQVCAEYRRLAGNGGGELILNITSGYRGVVPAARDAALLLAADARERGRPITISMRYLYQSADHMVRYDPLPLAFDWSILPSLAMFAEADSEPGVLETRITPEQRPFFESAEGQYKHRRISPLGAVAYALRRALD